MDRPNRNRETIRERDRSRDNRAPNHHRNQNEMNYQNYGPRDHAMERQQREREDNYQVSDPIDCWYTNQTVNLDFTMPVVALLAQISHIHLTRFRENVKRNLEIGRFDPLENLQRYDGSFRISRNAPPKGTSYSSFAFYQVRESKGKPTEIYKLISCHGNLQGVDDKLGIKHLWLDHRSREIFFNRHFSGRLIRGDIVAVFNVRRDKMDKKLYVDEFLLMEREFVANQIVVVTRIDGHRRLITPMLPIFGFELIWESGRVLPSGATESVWVCLLFMPVAEPFFHSAHCLKPCFNTKELNYIKLLLTDATWINMFGVILAISDEQRLANLKNCKTICENGMNAEALAMIEEKDKLILTTVQACRNHKKNFQFDFRQFTRTDDVDVIAFHVPQEFEEIFGVIGAEVTLYQGRSVIKMKVVQVDSKEKPIKIWGKNIEEEGFDEHSALILNETDPWGIIVAQISHYGGPNLIEIYQTAITTPIEGTNAEQTMIEMHGGSMRQVELHDEPIDPNLCGMGLNIEQVLHVKTVLSWLAMAMTFAPFGCGKSYDIIGGLVHLFNFAKSISVEPFCLVMARTNSAVGNLVKIAGTIWSQNKEEQYLPKIVRFISKRVYDLLPEEERTDYDLPALLESFYTLLVEGRASSMSEEERYYTEKYCRKYKRYDLLKKFIHVRNSENKFYYTPEAYYLITTGIKVIFCTIDTAFVSVADTLRSIDVKGTSMVTNIQIDEASVVAVYELICIVRTFPMAAIVIVGDKRQLGPHNELKLSPFMDEMIMTSALDIFEEDAVVTVRLTDGYRCDVDNTEAASRLFYEAFGYPPLRAVGDSEYKRSKRAQFHCFGDGKKSMTFVKGNTKSTDHGTSYINEEELELVKIIVAYLQRGGVSKAEIGVISLYKPQHQSFSIEIPDIKSGTAEVFQACERDYMVVCLTNTGEATEFATLDKRVNVAITRAKIGVIIVGNKNAVDLADYWNVIVDQYCNIVEPSVFDQQFDNIEADGIAAQEFPELRENNDDQRNAQARPIHADRSLPVEVSHPVPPVYQLLLQMPINLMEQGSSASCLPSNSRQNDLVPQFDHLRLRPSNMSIDLNEQGSSSMCVQDNRQHVVDNDDKNQNSDTEEDY